MKVLEDNWRGIVRRAALYEVARAVRAAEIDGAAVAGIHAATDADAAQLDFGDGH